VVIQDKYDHAKGAAYAAPFVWLSFFIFSLLTHYCRFSPEPTTPTNPQIKTCNPTKDSHENGNSPAKQKPQEQKPVNPQNDDLLVQHCTTYPIWWVCGTRFFFILISIMQKEQCKLLLLHHFKIFLLIHYNSRIQFEAPKMTTYPNGATPPVPHTHLSGCVVLLHCFFLFF
jgi:hypothetical protein